MLSEEAHQLAGRIVGVWPASPNKSEWTEELVRLEQSHANATFLKLRRYHEDRWLTIATFHATYAKTKERNAGDEVGPCGRCDSIRWIPVTKDGDPLVGDLTEGRYWSPCPDCGGAAGTERTHERILTWNTKH